MSTLLRRYGKVFLKRRSGRCWLAVALALVLGSGLSGCKTWGTHDDELRDSDLSGTARQARAEKQDRDKKKEPDDPWMSERANQISHDLQ